MGMMVVMQRREMVVIIHQERFSGPEREDRGRWDRREEGGKGGSEGGRGVRREKVGKWGAGGRKWGVWGGDVG